MLPRFNLLARKEWLRGDSHSCRALLCRLYTTSHDNGSSSPINVKHTTDEELVNDDHFWEVSLPKAPIKRPTETINFRQLLDTVLKDRQKKDNTYITKGITPTNLTGSSSQNEGTEAKRRSSLIEKRLLEMVMNRKQVFKQKSPLPRNMMPAIYGKTSTIAANATTNIDKKTLDSTQLDAIRQNQAIKDHDREIKTIDDLLSTTTRQDLLGFFTNCMTDYQKQQTFPAYYSSLVKNAIHHAYTDFRDPYLAVALFEQCKTMSLQSYIEGCTVDVYNQVLQLRWDAWEDIYGMLDLMEEMTLNGVAFNNVSAGIVQTITDEMERQELIDGVNQVQRWSPDDVRSTELMKILVGKWIFK